MRSDRDTPRLRLSAGAGFSLIELLVVVTIVATLAVLVLPRVDGSQRRAGVVTALTNLIEVERALEVYASQPPFRYPSGWDSLLEASAPYAPYRHIGALEPSDENTAPWLETHILSATEYGHLRQICGDLGVHDHEPGAADYNSSASATLRSLGDGQRCAAVRTTGRGELVLAQPDLAVPKDHVVLAFGIGPRSGLVGTERGVLFQAPVCPALHFRQEYAYRRPVALFAVPDADAPEGHAHFLGVVTSLGESCDTLRKGLGT